MSKKIDLYIGDLLVTINPTEYSLKDGKLEMTLHVKSDKFESDITVGKWICFDCKTLNDLDTIYCKWCKQERPGESNR